MTNATAPAVTLTRVLLVMPAILLAFGGVAHMRAFSRGVDAVAASNIEPFFGNALKALWLMDSAGMYVLSAVCVTIVLRPPAASGLVIAMLSLIPFSTAALLYVFIGNFFAAHMLMVAGASMAGAAISQR